MPANSKILIFGIGSGKELFLFSDNKLTSFLSLSKVGFTLPSGASGESLPGSSRNKGQRKKEIDS